MNRNKLVGFTLIELLIAVAIVGIISAVAYPSYVDSMARSNRSEGQRELLRIANLQEQFYVDNRAYTNNMAALGLPADPFVTEFGNYSIDGVVAGATFVLTATAQGSQATNDSGCSPMTVSDTGLKSPVGCWGQ